MASKCQIDSRISSGTPRYGIAPKKLNSKGAKLRAKTVNRTENETLTAPGNSVISQVLSTRKPKPATNNRALISKLNINRSGLT